jgi:hypothetical protein
MKTNYPLVRIASLLCGIVFLGSEVVLQATIWPKWGPTAAFLAGLVPLALFGWIVGSLNRKSIPNEEPPERNGRKAMLKPVLAIVWLLGMLSWFPMAEIESAALSQPDHPTGQFTQPMDVKGVVRYVTPKQATIDEISRWGFLGGWLALVGGALLYRWLEKRDS